MDEGKPTKAKWWSRPRPQEPAGDRHAAHDADSMTAPSPPTPDGDFELARPATPGEDGFADGASDAPDGGPDDANGPADDAGGTDEAFGGTGLQEPAADPDTAASVAGVPVGPESVAAARPKPLHDPDPYSTPPYGEPGPWAPAPPVQHPAVTAAHGTSTALGMTVPPSVPSVPSVPSRAVPPSAVPGPWVTPRGAAPVAAAAPGADPTVAPGAAAVPAQGVGPGPDAAVAPGPDPAHGTLPAAPADSGDPLAAPAASGSAPAPAVPTAPAVGDTGFDPWQRYDPWAAASRRETYVHDGPWQQTGAGAVTAGQRRRWVRRQLVGGAVAVALVSGVLGGAVGGYLERNGGLDPIRLPQASAEPAGRAADSVAGIAARALPSVVTLHVSGGDEGGTGTGFVLDSLGYILTNNHVVEPAGSDGAITVVFNGGQTAKAEVVGRDSGYDLAVVRVTGVKGLKPLYLGNSDNVRVGDPVVAIGAPFDLEGTVTSGIISAKERPITAGGDGGDADDVSYVDALQTDAPINPGNSGGPLLDARGHVIGINSAIRSADEGVGAGDVQSGSIGLGFAIPINQGKRVAEELINNGRATHPVIGISLDLQYAGDGARISAKSGDGGPPVTVGGPGARAGLRGGDVVTEVDGQRVHSGEELIVRTRAHRPGDRLRLTILRDGAERTVTLVLGSSGGG
ncbi:trypsin-like peptidase domain-containing protein [Streptomyces sp. NPDC054884]